MASTTIHNNPNILINHISEKEFYPIKARPVDQRKSYLLGQQHPERWQFNHTHPFHKDKFFLMFNFFD